MTASNPLTCYRDYQIEWLMSHCDIELEPKLEQLIVQFLKDTAECFIREHEDAEVDYGK